jgi:A/G-specific adenine glycosylase
MAAFVPRLLAWYAAHHRRLPWREAVSPYEVWLSEIMLQQTRVDTVVPYFERFRARFPTVEALAAADLQEVLKLWAGLGYYSRARSLHAAAEQVVLQHGGRFPRTAEGLAELPGVGPYTAAAIASMAFGEPVPVIDGNVLRVFARFLAEGADVRSPAVRRAIQASLAAALLDGPSPGHAPVDPGTFNNAIMELGALVCTPREPRCPECPLASDCEALRQGRVSELPVKTKRAPTPHHDVAVGVIWREGRVLIARRPVTVMLGGLWELPGGKRRPRESLEAAARREILEETGLDVEVGPPCATVDHAYSHLRITLTAFHCRVRSGEARPLASDEVRFVLPSELRDVPLPRATEKVVEALLASGYPPPWISS